MGKSSQIAKPVAVPAGKFVTENRLRARLLSRRIQELLLTTAISLIPLAGLTGHALAVSVGDVITQTDGTKLTVTEVNPGAYVAVDVSGKEYAILDIPAVNDTLSLPTGQDQDGHLVYATATVTGFTTSNGNTVTTYTIVNGQAVYQETDDKGNVTATYPITSIVYSPTINNATTLDVVTPLEPETTDSSSNSVPGVGYSDVRRASNGKNGRAGALFVPATSGKDGTDGQSFSTTKTVNPSIVANGPGIVIASIGGNGGKGGNSYLGTGGKPGGDAGAGGNVVATVNGQGSVTTHGDGNVGIAVQSRAGVGGKGGTGYATGGGGSGGTASHGGSATLDNSVNVTTDGKGAHGILVQSLGGGAGDGGSSYGLFGDAGGSGAGGNGGAVDITNSGKITTTGDGAHGIFGQSIGGQGGDGGNAVGIVAFAGGSGVGGDGGSVTIANNGGKITTSGERSYGIFGQSVGGSGGTAGFNAGLVALGADAGSGGNGGNVTISTDSSSFIGTIGSGSHAVFAQSVGGGGGDAGFSGGLVALGAKGGAGGNAGNIDVTLGGAAHTKGAGASGVFAQSVGGGGGSGQTSAGLVALGSGGESGGDAGNVSVTVQSGGSILTEGTAARGIVAQSIGGGGGDAGTTGGLVALGGSGSKGGKSGTVSVISDGNVTTNGDGSDAIFAQSVGGGGGSAGSSGGFVSIGGSGAAGGDGGAVTVKNGGNIATSGEMSRGILAQSVGGGGGVAGSGGGVFVKSGAGGKGGDASIGGSYVQTGSETVLSNGGGLIVENTGAIATLGSMSSGIEAQSIGGGGGDGGNAAGMVSIGGKGGSGGNGGSVLITNKGDISTGGNDSNGILAQSIGGGGGNGGWSVGAGVFGAVSLGGSGAAGGKGGTVDLTFADSETDAGTITTKGDRSRGILAQSIGGGGGAGGWSVAGSVGMFGSIATAIGGTGGVGGDGGTITADGYVNIGTKGDFSEGMLLQSVGGGGGAGGFSVAGTAGVGPFGASLAVAIGGNGGIGGDGGNITFDNGGGLVQTEGNFSNGLVAQSIGGGGGAGGFATAGGLYIGGGGALTASLGGGGGAGGKGGTVDIDYDGGIKTFGTSSNGVLLQSVGGGGGSGGFSISAALSAGASAASLGIGGAGGAGGAGGSVTGTIGGDVYSQGDRSTGVIVQSVGGGGGAGGYAISGAGAGGIIAAAVSAGIGGSGGAAGAGGVASGTVNGTITTIGDQSNGMLVQSVGGGGGSGGYAVSGAVSGGAVAASISAGVGGSGGGGGAGGSAAGKAAGQISTKGDQSNGMVVQSIGGGGGAGGFTITGSGSGGLGAASISAGIGGNGGVASASGAADGEADSGIYTEGNQSTGIVVQSIGGGGGSGGYAISGAVAGGVGAGAITAGIGGSGGAGGDAGTATALVGGAIETHGDQSGGMLVQSLGGGGGNGGFAITGAASGGVGAGSLAASIGGSGAGGGQAVDASGTAESTVLTTGTQSSGIVVQSIGGGGGNGGYAITGGAAGGVGAGAITAGIGGSGAVGGKAGNATGLAKSKIEVDGDQSAGMLVQSIGGGGGNGGFAIAGSVAGGVGAGGISAAVGGTGSGGGAGAAASGTAEASILTFGNQSSGMIVQSIGGGGGNGGYTIAGALAGGEGAGTIALGIGGSGGPGSGGGIAYGNVLGVIETHGDQSNGMLVQSIGGGGGSGGFTVTGAGAGGIGAGAISVGIGGSGDNGGNGGNATGIAGDSIFTYGDQSVGMIVQSIGGGGGAGGFNVSGVVAGGEAAGAVALGLGGSGKGGGNAGDVYARARSIYTAGDDATGFLAQSLGGGGGSGGFNVSGSIAVAAVAAGSVSVGMGGSGAGGGNGGTVDAGVDGDVTTLGDRSNGIVAQSLGGGGGSGGFNVSAGLAAGGEAAGVVAVGLGGSGGGGGNGGNVTLTVDGSTRTGGESSTGILAQSIGGGGGNGGFNVTGGIAASGEAAGTIGVSIGGTGDGGGDAGNVSLAVVGNVTDENVKLAASTAGNNSTAIIAQSVGGGGGSGGFSVVGGISASGEVAGNIAVGIGGAGGKGGKAAAVTADADGAIVTLGDDSGGLLAQSVGGGGGSGGFSVAGAIAVASEGAGNIAVGVGGFGDAGGDAGNVRGNVTGDIYTEGDRSFGLTYQSLGGGGGSGGFNVTGGVSLSMEAAGNVGVGIGGFGAAGGDAGNVNLTYAGNILTKGDQAYAVLAQSVGGGGGSGGMNITGGITGSQQASGNLGVGIGGFGAGAGDAGDVTALLTGNVETMGADSYGTLLQSLGGAGGAGGMNITGGVSLTTGKSGTASVSLGLGGFGGGGGSAGNVDGSVTGTYITHGDGAFGVAAQSIGGGGGAGGMNISGSVAAGQGESAAIALGVGGFGGTGGKAGSVVLTRVGDMQTSGSNADGVLAQSIGGGGGAGGINVAGALSATTNGEAASISLGLGGFGGSGGDAGSVTSHVTGNVWAKATTERSKMEGSNGVVAQSIGGGGGTGGLNVSMGVSIGAPKKADTNAATIGIGGFGGAGGDASTVDLTVDAPGTDRVQVQATGDNKSAVIAQSIGGGGGAGGINIAGSLALDGSVTIGIGGSGGSGGKGGDVVTDIDADFFANGDYSRGLMAQSIGGGGGSGTINVAAGIQADQESSQPSVAFGLGGSGGAGNVSGNVDATQHGLIVTDGSNAVGALIQSIAGGGGSGGLNAALDISLADKDSYAFAAGIGGSGGTGADAGNVSFNSNGNILINQQIMAAVEDGTNTTFTGGGAGVLAQSIGGGGGTGGINVTGAVSKQGSPVALGVGGSGGSGGNAGTVDVTRGYTMVNGVETPSAGVIDVYGDDVKGLVAQSIGGGGGNAGSNVVLGVLKKGDGNQIAVSMAVGGGGAGAGSGDAVSVRHNGTILTDGGGGDGLVAQSIGGGGGNAANNIIGGYEKNAELITNIAVGGATGAAGDGGSVKVDHVGNILTLGDISYGIVAQSIGGGGGNIKSSQVKGKFDSKNSISVSLGRAGGSGGTGGAVVVDAEGNILTFGDRSSAILAQSLGGGGGTSDTTSISAKTTEGQGDDASTSSASLSLGIAGGQGATSGMVTVNFDGRIATASDEAKGIVAQSIGGGGGVAGGASTSVTNDTTAVALALGGNGGKGASSDKVDVTNKGVITTDGASSDGILAQSIGGGGGLAGSAKTTIKEDKGNGTANVFSIGLGGSGGEGARSDAVTVANSGTISTQGWQSFGIRAQSIGGGGGVGGSSENTTTVGNRNSESIILNVGGSGGTGAAAGSVDVDNSGLIYTVGDNAIGISANSIGGGGGDAGSMKTTVSGKSASSTADNYAMNLGGSGGEGGTGGDVSVTNRVGEAELSGQIITRGDAAYGILAQSIGGGGGNGSAVVDKQGSEGTGSSSVVALSVGGSGGKGESAGAVTVDNSGLIDTSGVGAHGIVAQSIGGGGGNGGMALTTNSALKSGPDGTMLSVGGFGADGGDGGAVRVDNSGNIITRGDKSDGIVAQSIGGGGGNAGLGLTLSTDVKSALVSGAINGILGAVGGGSGGQGGEVTVNHSGDITVLGKGSAAIRAESINGGGGTISMDLDGIIGLLKGSEKSDGTTETDDSLVAMRAGAEGAQGMNAMNVHVNSTGTFGAGGDMSVGDIAQAIGGGGGTVNLHSRVVADSSQTNPGAVNFELGLGGQDGSTNNGGALASTQTGDIVTTGLLSAGVISQSIGGGGGMAVGDFMSDAGAVMGNVGIRLGSLNTTEEAGSTVNRSQSGQIVTTGQLATGALLQSIGGGGGSAIVNVAGSGTNGERQVSLGAVGGYGADASDVTAGFTGGVQTSGAGSVGLMLQSVGGGGGEVRLAGEGATSAVLGGLDDVSGDGGNLVLANSGAITTAGDSAHGVLLQSIGGGGGAVLGTGASTGVSLNSANSGFGGSISFDQVGNITTLGRGAYGLVVQSLGGGGGWVDGAFAGSAGGFGAGGAVDLNVNGMVFSAAENSVGAFVQSTGLLGGGNVTLNFADMVRGGSGTGAGIVVDGGADNTVTTLGSLSAVSGWALRTSSGDDKIENDGLTVGNFDLGGGNNAFHNALGATYMAFNTMRLRDQTATTAGTAGPFMMRSAIAPLAMAAGSTATFTNDGDFLMGLEGPRWSPDLAGGYVYPNMDDAGDPTTNLLYGARVINTVALDGNFVQTSNGHMVFDVAFGPYASDRVNVTGDATVAGTAAINLMWLENDQPVTLFATEGKGVNEGMTVPDTLALRFGVLGDDAGIHLTVASHFSQDFLMPNERRLGNHLDSALKEGGANGIGRLMAAVGNLVAGQEGTYRKIFDELNPEGLIAPLQTHYREAGIFSDQLFQCRWKGMAGDHCVWANAGGTKMDQKADADYWGATSRFYSLRTGVEQKLDHGWSVTGAIGYNRIDNISVNGGRYQAHGDSLDLGFGARHQWENGADLSIKATAGFQWLDSERYMDVFAPAHGEASSVSSYGQLQAEIGYMAQASNWSVHPALALTGTVLHLDDYQESGLGGLGARISANTQFIGAIEPKVTLGYDYSNGTGLDALFAVTGGYSYRSTGRIKAPISLIGASADATPAMISTPLDRGTWKLGAGIELRSQTGWSLKGDYEGQFGDRTDVHSGSVKLLWRF